MSRAGVENTPARTYFLPCLRRAGVENAPARTYFLPCLHLTLKLILRFFLKYLTMHVCMNFRFHLMLM